MSRGSRTTFILKRMWERDLSHFEMITNHHMLRKVEVETLDWAERVTPFLLKVWDLDNIERVSWGCVLDNIERITYHYTQTNNKWSSKSRRTLLQVWIPIKTLAKPSGSHNVEKSRSWLCREDHERHMNAWWHACSWILLILAKWKCRNECLMVCFVPVNGWVHE